MGYRTLVGGIFLLCRDAVSVFYSPSQIGYWTLVGGILLLCRDAVGVLYSHPPPSDWTRKACGVDTSALDCDVIVSNFELNLRFYVQFRFLLTEKIWTTFSCNQWVKQSHCCSSKNMVWAANNPCRLIWHETRNKMDMCFSKEPYNEVKC